MDFGFWFIKYVNLLNEDLEILYEIEDEVDYVCSGNFLLHLRFYLFIIFEFNLILWSSPRYFFYYYIKKYIIQLINQSINYQRLIQ